jgi:hypothetical protein
MMFQRIDSFSQSGFQKLYGDSLMNLDIPAINFTHDKGIIALGHLADTSNKIAVFKTDSIGHILWSKIIRGVNPALSNYHMNSIIETSDKNILIAGDIFEALLIKMDSSGNVIWSKTYSNFSYGTTVKQIIELQDSNYLIGGHTAGFFRGWDLYLMKIDKSGNVLWNKGYDSPQWDEFGFTISEASNHDILIGGSITDDQSSRTDALIMRTDSNGNINWVKTYGSSFNGRIVSIIPTSDTGSIVLGIVQTLLPNNGATLLMKVNQFGDTLWKRFFINNSIGLNLFDNYDGSIAFTATGTFGKFYLTVCDTSGNVLQSKSYIDTTNISTNPPVIQSTCKTSANYVYGGVISRWSNSSQGILLITDTTFGLSCFVDTSLLNLTTMTLPVNNVSMTIASGCIDTIYPLVIYSGLNEQSYCQNINVSLEEIEFVFDIGPNPMYEKLIITTDDILGTIQILNYSGSLLYSQQLHSKSTILELQNINAGIYFLKILSNKKNYIKKLIVVK